MTRAPAAQRQPQGVKRHNLQNMPPLTDLTETWISNENTSLIEQSTRLQVQGCKWFWLGLVRRLMRIAAHLCLPVHPHTAGISYFCHVMAALCLCRAVRPSLDAMCLQSMALTEKRRSFRCLVEDNAAPNRFVQRRPSRIRNVVTPSKQPPAPWPEPPPREIDVCSILRCFTRSIP